MEKERSRNRVIGSKMYRTEMDLKLKERIAKRECIKVPILTASGKRSSIIYDLFQLFCLSISFFVYNRIVKIK